MKTKALIALLLAAVTLALTACSGGELLETAETATQAAQTEVTETEEKYSVWSPMSELPNYVLSAGASTDEIRAMAVKAMRDELTVQWYVDKGFSYYNANGTEMTVNAGEVYAGLPYTQSGSGLLQWLQYYDPETGNMPGLDASVQGTLGNSCAASVMWGWSSVVSSIDWNTTYLMTPGHGCLPVGGYKVDMNLMSYKDYTTTKIVADNGEQVMCKAYAAVLPADAVISFMDESSAHAQMIIEAPHVEYRADGSIDPDKSYVVIQDQHKGILKTGEPFVTEVDGNRVHYAGHVRQEETFRQLLKANYVPVTTAEFTGAKGYDMPRVEARGVDTFTSLDDLKGLTVYSVYKIITIRMAVEDGETTVLEQKKVLGRSEIEKGTAIAFDMDAFTMPIGLGRKLEKGKTYTLKLEVLDTTGTNHTVVNTEYTYNG